MAFYLRNSAFIIKRYLPNGKSSIVSKIPFQNFNNYKYLHVSTNLNKIVSFNLSDIGEGIREVTIKEWFVKIGDTVEQFDNLCEVQSDKASVTITSRYDGKIVKMYHKVDEIALVGKPLLDFDVLDDNDENVNETKSSSDSDDDQKSSIVKQKEIPQTESKSDERIKVLATPAVRRIAMEKKVNLSKVPATGKLGRILKGDVLEYLGEIPPGTNILHPTLRHHNISEKKTAAIPVDRVEILKGVRKAMYKSMSESLKIPHFAYSDEIDMTNLVQFRHQLSEAAIEHGVNKLTFMPFCIKAASLALSKYPILNSSLCEKTESIIYKGAHNISVAMDTPQGLVVPNVKNCQEKSILDIARDLNTLMEKGRNGSLKPDDFMDGTFSLSNIGIIGGTYTHPCIMTPQVSIGAMGRTKVVPRFGPNDEIVKAHIMNVSWSADHRVIDGVTMAKFSNLWKKYLENPALFIVANSQ